MYSPSEAFPEYVFLCHEYCWESRVIEGRLLLLPDFRLYTVSCYYHDRSMKILDLRNWIHLGRIVKKNASFVVVH